MKKKLDKTLVDDHGLSETIPLRPENPAERLAAWLRREIAAAEDDLRQILLMPSSEARALALGRRSARREALVQALDRLESPP